MRILPLNILLVGIVLLGCKKEIPNHEVVSEKEQLKIDVSSIPIDTTLKYYDENAPPMSGATILVVEIKTNTSNESKKSCSKINLEQLLNNYL